MSREKIDWSAHLQAPEVQSGGEVVGRMDEFVQRAAAELEPLYIGDDIVAKVEKGGCRVTGTRYFAMLYASYEGVTSTERIKSAFLGSVAHGREDLAAEAYTLLATSTDSVDELHKELVDSLNGAMKNEQWWGGWDRYQSLEAAAKALHKPLFHRVLGGLAAGMAMHAYQVPMTSRIKGAENPVSEFVVTRDDLKAPSSSALDERLSSRRTAERERYKKRKAALRILERRGFGAARVVHSGEATPSSSRRDKPN